MHRTAPANCLDCHDKSATRDLLHSRLSRVRCRQKLRMRGRRVGANRKSPIYLPSEVVASHANFFWEPLYCAERAGRRRPWQSRRKAAIIKMKRWKKMAIQRRMMHRNLLSGRAHTNGSEGLRLSDAGQSRLEQGHWQTACNELG